MKKQAENMRPVNRQATSRQLVNRQPVDSDLDSNLDSDLDSDLDTDLDWQLVKKQPVDSDLDADLDFHLDSLWDPFPAPIVTPFRKLRATFWDPHHLAQITQCQKCFANAPP